MRILEGLGRKGFPPLTPEPLRPMPSDTCRDIAYDVIAISRTYGSRGSVVGKLVAERLNYTFLDKEIFEHIVEHSGAPTHRVQRYDEKPDQIWSIVREMFDSTFTHSRYVHALVKALRQIGERGHVVVVGRGAQFAIPTSFKVRVIAPLELRAHRMMEEDGLSLEAEIKHVKQADAGREQFLKAVFRKDARDPELYHLVINTGMLSLEDAADLIICGVHTAQCHEHNIKHVDAGQLSRDR